MRDVAGAVGAVAAVAALVLALNLAFGTPDVASPRGGQGPVVSAPPGSAPRPASPPAHSTPAPVESATPSARPPLTVLNHSRIAGLAARAAERFRSAGWTIAEVGNTRLDVVRTTVFFAPGQEGAAAALRAQFPEVLASEPRPAALPGSGLTVVVTREFPA